MMAALALAGCTSPEPAYFTLAAVPGQAAAGGPKLVEMQRPGLAGYLDRPGIVRANGAYQLQVAGTERWGEPLGDLVGRILSEDLNQRLPGTSVFTTAGSISAQPDARIELDVQRFDADASGDVVLLAQVAVSEDGPFAGRDPAALQFAGGYVVGADGAAHSLADLLKASPAGSLDASAEWKPDTMPADKAQYGLLGGFAIEGPITKTHAIYSFGAQFAEVRVDPLLRTVRVARMVGAFACGRVINPRTARSNLMGGMIWGASFALLEETQVDRPRARFANQDLASYHISTCADIGEVTAEIVDETDTVVNAIGAKAVGEIGIVGMPAAIANAVYHATGIRVRKTPILIEDLLPP